MLPQSRAHCGDWGLRGPQVTMSGPRGLWVVGDCSVPGHPLTGTPFEGSAEGHLAVTYGGRSVYKRQLIYRGTPWVPTRYTWRLIGATKISALTLIGVPGRATMGTSQPRDASRTPKVSAGVICPYP
jgi:hypothetical protein